MKITFAVGEYNEKSGIIKVVNNIAKKLSEIENYDISILATGIAEQSSDMILFMIWILKNMAIEEDIYIT